MEKAYILESIWEGSSKGLETAGKAEGTH